MERPAPAFRFASDLCAVMASPARGKPIDSQAAGAQVVADWLAICRDVVSNRTETTRVASAVISLFQLAAYTLPQSKNSSVPNRLQEELEASAKESIVTALRAGEVAGGRGFAVTVSGDVLFGAVQAYLQTLPVGPQGAFDSPERALRHERYLGRREVAEPLLLAMAEVTDSPQLRDAVEVVLHNVGVREYGSLGEMLLFDPHSHQPVGAGVLPGAPVVVTRPGRRLGTDAQGIVLVKALVDVGARPPVDGPSA